MKPIHCPFCGYGEIYLGGFEETMEESSNLGYAGEEISCKRCYVMIREHQPYEFRDPDYWTEYDREKIMVIREKLITKWNTRY